MVEGKSIEPHVPVWDKTERKDGTLSRSDFQWNAEANEYRCPKDKPLRSTGNATSADLLGAQDEFLLAATAQNLRRMAQWLMPKTPSDLYIARLAG